MSEEIIPLDTEQLKRDAYALEANEIEQMYNDGLLEDRQKMYDLQETARQKYFGKDEPPTSP